MRVSDQKTVGSIDKGLLLLIGVGKDDTIKNAEVLADKIAKLRVMADENDKMNLSVLDAQSSVLAVSQFTLYADTSGGNRPSFIGAAQPDKARKIYNHFVEKAKDLGIKVETGSFGDYMTIKATLDGPVTIVLEG